MDIREFIEARVAEVEAAARAATPGPWRYNSAKHWLLIDDEPTRALAARAGIMGEEFVGCGPLDSTVCVAATGPADDPQSMADARFIAGHDPAQVLRDVEAKRRILAAYVDDDRVRFGAFESCSDSCPATVLDEVLKLLALPYDQHPDYDESWRP